MPRELVIGAGNLKVPRLQVHKGQSGYSDPTYLDIDARAKPDVLHDLNDRPLPFEDEAFDEIHAYEVLEHVGRQGDWRGFFEEWAEYYRILTPGGIVVGSVPDISSKWVWADPGHTRMLTVNTFGFLNQESYAQVGETMMTDYRDIWKGDFKIEFFELSKDLDPSMYFVLRKYPLE